MTKPKFYFFILPLFIFFSSCRKHEKILQNENAEPISNEKIFEIKNELQQRFSLIQSIVLDVFYDNPNLFEKFKKSINKNNLQKGSEAIYFKDLLKNPNKFESSFAETFLHQIVTRFKNEDFNGSDKLKPIINKLKEKISILSLSNRTNDDLVVTVDVLLLTYLGSNMYFPFSELFPNATTSQSYFCSEPLDENATTVEVTQTVNGFPSTQVVTGSDTWAEQNPTVVLRLDDQIAGNHLDQYTQSPCAQGDFFEQLCPIEELNYDEVNGVDSIPPPPAADTCNFLTYNIAPSFYNQLDTNYIFSSVIPHYRLMDNLRWAFWSGSNRISFYKAKAKIVTPDITDVAQALGSNSIKVFEDQISRKTARNKEWIYPSQNPVYSDDWRMVESDNYQALTVVKHWLTVSGPTISYNVSAGVKWDTTRVPTIIVTSSGGTITVFKEKGWIPNASANVGVSGSISVRVRETVEGEMNTTRRSFVSFAVGDNFGMGTSVLQNTNSTNFGEPAPYSIRSCGTKFQYYFKPRICY